MTLTRAVLALTLDLLATPPATEPQERAETARL